MSLRMSIFYYDVGNVMILQFNPNKCEIYNRKWMNFGLIYQFIKSILII